ncbi:MAG: type I DNA topoisomerase [Eubacteriales bacterium]|nr:type I DNA topoisomerase [Eubacteriales bacterium]
MSNALVIVESPAKVKTISKFLGKKYIIDASLGHIVDLPKSKMGIDLNEDFNIHYITIRGKGELLKKLKKEASKSDEIYLATDPDREGETISWHLKNVLKEKDNSKKVYRISFNEITEKAVKEAIKNPRDIDMNLVDAQQARRSMDRIVGYSISPILWAKIKRGLSAGRVQSVALKMICDREKEINEFVQQEYWTLNALLNKNSEVVDTSFYGSKNNKIALNSEEDVEKIIKEIEKEEFIVKEVNFSTRQRKAPLPFITSSLQQEAGSKFSFPAAKTMRIAQKLYEGVDIKGKGHISLITYLRTDSTRISDYAIEMSSNFIKENYGEKYLSNNINQAKNKNSKVQDAHEAIRPTYIDILPSKIKDSLQRDEYRLYDLIWRRFIASRMTNAEYSTSSYKYEAGEYIFSSNHSKLDFEGFLLIYDNDLVSKEKKVKFPNFEKGDVLKLNKFEKTQHFTDFPPHFTESSLVKALEENGIGRPSTYAPTIQTIIKRRYITKEKKNIFVTELGQAVNSFMEKSFDSIIDEQFTKKLEEELDQVEEGTKNWKDVLREFYPKFKLSLDKAVIEAEKIEIKDEETDIKCEKCGRNMVIKYGPFGKFLACPGFPDCKNTKVYLEKTGLKCPNCNSEIIKLRTKKGRIFYGCENKDCNFMTWKLPKEENPK